MKRWRSLGGSCLTAPLGRSFSESELEEEEDEEDEEEELLESFFAFFFLDRFTFFSFLGGAGGGGRLETRGVAPVMSSFLISFLTPGAAGGIMAPGPVLRLAPSGGLIRWTADPFTYSSEMAKALRRTLSRSCWSSAICQIHSFLCPSQLKSTWQTAKIESRDHCRGPQQEGGGKWECT